MTTTFCWRRIMVRVISGGPGERTGGDGHTDLDLYGLGAFPGRPESVSDARAFVQGLLAGRHAGAVSDAALLTSELVTNAVLHTRSGHPGGCVLVAVLVCRGTLRIEVVDQGAVTAPEVVHAAAMDGTGRGMFLVDALARRWGSGPDEDGRTTWFELPVGAG